MANLLNPKLHEVVRKLYEEFVAEFSNRDLHAEEFLSSFPYDFVGHGNEEYQRQIIEAALLPEFRQETEKAIEAY